MQTIVSLSVSRGNYCFSEAASPVRSPVRRGSVSRPLDKLHSLVALISQTTRQLLNLAQHSNQVGTTLRHLTNLNIRVRQKLSDNKTKLSGVRIVYSEFSRFLETVYRAGQILAKNIS